MIAVFRCVCVLAACAAALLVGGTGVAQAAVTDSYSVVRQVVCSETGARLDISYTNAYGNTTSRSGVSLRGNPIGDGRTCITLDSRSGEYGDVVGTTVSADAGGYVYCAIFVDGRKVAESVDDSSYYSSAYCG